MIFPILFLHVSVTGRKSVQVKHSFDTLAVWFKVNRSQVAPSKHPSTINMSLSHAKLNDSSWYRFSHQSVLSNC